MTHLADGIVPGAIVRVKRMPPISNVGWLAAEARGIRMPSPGDMGEIDTISHLPTQLIRVQFGPLLIWFEPEQIEAAEECPLLDALMATRRAA